jgi:hypothetical protein
MPLHLVLTRRCLCHSFSALAATVVLQLQRDNITTIAEPTDVSRRSRHLCLYLTTARIDPRQSFGGAAVCLFVFLESAFLTHCCLRARLFTHICLVLPFVLHPYCHAKHRRGFQPDPIVLTTRRGASIYGALVSTVTSTRHAKNRNNKRPRKQNESKGARRQP